MRTRTHMRLMYNKQRAFNVFRTWKQKGFSDPDATNLTT